MLAVNITKSVAGGLDDRDPADLRALAAKWWVLSDETATGYADTLLAIAHNTIAGVYAVRGWHRDPDAGGKVVFDLADDPGWQFLVGEPAPEVATWSRGQANPVRKVDAATAAALADRRPARTTGEHGWVLEVDADGQSATVRAPGPVAISALDGQRVRLHQLPQILDIDPGPWRDGEIIEDEATRAKRAAAVDRDDVGAISKTAAQVDLGALRAAVDDHGPEAGQREP